MGSPGRKKYECSECTRPCSTVRPAAIRACPATWPPKTRWRSSSSWVPRKMLTSMGSRSSRSTRKSREALMRPCSQAVGGRAPDAAARPPLPCGGVTAPTPIKTCASSCSPRGSPGAWRRRPTRSRAATSTTTGGTGSTPRRRARSSRAATPVTPSTAGARTSGWWRTWASAPTASRSSGAASSRPRGSSPGRSRALPPDVRGLPRRRHPPGRHLPPLHLAAAGSPPAAGGRPPTPPSALPAT